MTLCEGQGSAFQELLLWSYVPAWLMIPLSHHLFHLVLRRYNTYFLPVSRNAYLSLITLPCQLIQHHQQLLERQLQSSLGSPISCFHRGERIFVCIWLVSPLLPLLINQ